MVIFGAVITVASFVKAPANKIQSSEIKENPQTENQVKGEQPTSVGDNRISGARERAKVVRVIDGDTIEIEGGFKVRYIGIDAPESTTSLECFGRESTNFNRQLVEGRIVELEKDVSETDKYGRLLRYVYIDEIFANRHLIGQGYAHASSYPPDIKYQDNLVNAEQEARENNRGLWSGCAGDQPQLADCPIKGNISSSGEKIYHLPGQKYYDKTVIDESRGERWFCSEEEAQSVGWRKSKI